MAFCEPWIEAKLIERLDRYKRRYPGFKAERVFEDVQTWEPKSQRWAPYMKDSDIRDLNRSYHKMRSLISLAHNED